MRKTLLSLTALIIMALTTVHAEVEYATPLKGKDLPIGNLLEWSTAWEDDSHLFLIERSIDGVEFENVGQLSAAGSSEENKGYRYLDTEATDGKFFYRLKETDSYGTATNSTIIVVDRKFPNNYSIVSIFSTEVEDTFECTIDARKPGELEYKLVNFAGETLLNETQLLAEGLNDIYVDLTTMERGIFTIKMTMEDEEEKITFQKVEESQERRLNASKNKINGGG